MTDKQEAVYGLMMMRGAVASLPEADQLTIKELKAAVEALLKPFAEGTDKEKSVAGLVLTLLTLEFAAAD